MIWWLTHFLVFLLGIVVGALLQEMARDADLE